MKDDGGPAFPICKWCDQIAIRKQGRIWLCAKQYRIQQMRVNAKRHLKGVPSYDYLEMLYARNRDLICPVCGRKMNWLASNGQSTVITLQHDFSGRIRFLCRACNTRHGSLPEDMIYKLSSDKSFCHACGRILGKEMFPKDRSRYLGIKSYCKECCREKYKRWERTGTTVAS